MSEAKPTTLVVNGWTLFAHPLFLDQLEALTRQVENLKQKDPGGYSKKNATKRLAAIAKIEPIAANHGKSRYSVALKPRNYLAC